jgi:hypothetical protein
VVVVGCRFRQLIRCFATTHHHPLCGGRSGGSEDHATAATSASLLAARPADVRLRNTSYDVFGALIGTWWALLRAKRIDQSLVEFLQ